MIKTLPIDLIDIAGNPRSDPGDLDELAASIRVHGVLQPIRVSENGTGRYQLIFGQRRLLASKLAAQTTIPADVYPASPDRDLATAIVENIQRRELNAIEEARAFRTLREHGMTDREIAGLIARSESHVKNRIRVLDTDPYIVASIEAGTLAFFHGHLLAGVPRNQQRSLAQRCVTERWTVDRLQSTLHPKVKPAPRTREPMAVSHTPETATRIAEGLQRFAAKVDPVLARYVVWVVASMDTFIETRFLDRHRAADGRVEDRTWVAVKDLPDDTLRRELARVVAEVIAEYGSQAVRSQLPKARP